MGVAAEGDGGVPDDAADSGMEPEIDDTDAASAGEDPAQRAESGVPDSRAARPEPFEHTFGAQAHPAEAAASDPGVSTTPAAGSTAGKEPSAPEPSADTPTATPEQ